MMAGCINQAKKILSKYDEVLFGPAPEVLIEPTHQAIRNLFASPEGKAFVARMAEGKEGSTADDTFIKGVIGAIPPVIPLAIRNKNLDGGFLRTALLLLGAVEILLAQYEVDIRSNANPAGLVGMSAAMHADFERCNLFGEELRGLRDFTKEMWSQYQTSLGLGSPFPNDSVTRKSARRKARYNQNRTFGRGQFRRPGLGRGQQEAPAASRPRSTICYDYQSGNCGRGEACRYDHTYQ